MEEIRPCSFPDWEKHCADKLDAERSAIIASGEINSVLSWSMARGGGDFQKQSHFPSKRPSPKELSFQLAIVINDAKYFLYLPNPSLYRFTYGVVILLLYFRPSILLLQWKPLNVITANIITQLMLSNWPLLMKSLLLL